MLEKLAEVKHDDKGYTETLSPWLARYHWYGGDNYIELPGQYTGKVAPNANNILKIVKFHEKVSIYHSLRRPIKLTAICSDGKSYSFLVKYGENLRQDERIQHIQELMSDQMKADKNCSQQKLSLRTYKVIPLNVDCGIISWVENTATIDSFLSQSDPEFNTANASALHQYRKFIMNAPIDKNKRIKPNVAAVLHYSPADVYSNLLKIPIKIQKKQLNHVYYLSLLSFSLLDFKEFDKIAKQITRKLYAQGIVPIECVTRVFFCAAQQFHQESCCNEHCTLDARHWRSSFTKFRYR